MSWGRRTSPRHIGLLVALQQVQAQRYSERARSSSAPSRVPMPELAIG